MRSARWVVLLCGPTLVVGIGTGAAALDDPALLEYSAIVRRYRAGEHEEAIRALVQLSPPVVERAARALLSGNGRQRLGATEKDLRAAALLHTDLALREASTAARGAMLTTAEELLVAATGEKAPTHCRWLEAVGLFHHGHMELTPARARYKRAVQLCPDDAQGWALLGQAYEAGETSKPRESTATTAATTGTTQTTRVDASNALVTVENTMQEAERAYRRAIEASPSLRSDLRLHLARCYQALGRRDDAQRELEGVLTTAPDPGIAYIASLLLGGLEETQGRFDDAARSYRAAYDAVPGAQIAMVALSHALHRGGRRRESAGIVEAWARNAQGEGTRPVEPWWVFTWGPAVVPRPEEAILSGLREELSR